MQEFQGPIRPTRGTRASILAFSHAEQWQLLYATDTHEFYVWDGTVMQLTPTVSIPVASVAGRTGAVTLAEGDISGLSADLAAKAPTTYVDSAVSAARAYTDTSVAAAVVSSESYTDVHVASEATARSSADSGKEDKSNKGQPSGYASLDSGGLIPTAQLPPLAITKPNVVSSQAQMLALTAEAGDVAIRTDLSKNYILKSGGDPTQLTDWLELLTPAAPVQSVNGHTGTVSLTTDDVSEGSNQYFTNGRASAASPVQSVAGRTGSVVIAQADVTGLTASLSAKADVSYVDANQLTTNTPMKGLPWTSITPESNSGATVLTSANVEWGVLFLMDEDFLVSNVSLSVGVALAGAKFGVALKDVSGNKISGADGISVAVSGAVRGAFSTPVQLRRKTAYWLTWTVTDITTVTIQNFLMTFAFGAIVNKTVTRSGSMGATSAGVTNSTNGTVTSAQIRIPVLYFD